MNTKRYKIIFSKRLNAYVVVGENATSNTKASGNSVLGALTGGTAAFGVANQFIGAVSAFFVAAVSTMAATATFAAPAINALPTGAQVAQGQVSTSQAGNVLTINQTSNAAVVNWNSFDIGAASKVIINQPNAKSIQLDRVVGGNASQIFGQLQSNGQVILVNPNGIMFGKDGSVNASSFTASTLGISDADFMAGKHNFKNVGGNGTVINDGTITANAGGYVALLGAQVTNNGKIIAQQGTAYLGAADAITVPVSAGGKIKLALSPAAINTSVTNSASGVIVAGDGQVFMQSAGLNDVASQSFSTVTQAGVIDVSGVRGGSATLLSDGGKIKVSGTIDASGTTPGSGGSIIVGRDVDTGKLAAVTDVGGATFKATKGFVETSADYLLTDGVQVQAGTWLLDPADVTISSGGNAGQTGFVPNSGAGSSNINITTLNNALNAGTSVTITTTNSGVAGTPTNGGSIFVNAAIEKTAGADATLTMNADKGIHLLGTSSITSTSNKLNVVLNSSGTVADGVIEITSSNIVTNGGSFTATSGSAGVAGGVIAMRGAINTTAASGPAGDVVLTIANHANAADIAAIYLATGSSINAGNVTMNATGNAAITGVINIERGSSITAAGNLDITGVATQANTPAVSIGTNAIYSPVTINVGGLTTITGTNNNVSSSSYLNDANVSVADVNLTSAGNVRIISTVSNIDGAAIYLKQTGLVSATSEIKSTAGTITMQAAQGGSVGVNGYKLTASGDIFLDNTGGAIAGSTLTAGSQTSGNHGVFLNNATIDGATVSIAGNTSGVNPVGAAASGVLLNASNPVSITARGGAITVVGASSGATATGNNAGVSAREGALTLSALSGTTITGTSNLTSQSYGVYLLGAGTTVSVGNLSITGSGGGGGVSIAGSNIISAKANTTQNVTIVGSTTATGSSQAGATVQSVGVQFGGNTGIDTNAYTITGTSTGSGSALGSTGVNLSGRFTALQNSSITGSSENALGYSAGTQLGYYDTWLTQAAGTTLAINGSNTFAGNTVIDNGGTTLSRIDISGVTFGGRSSFGGGSTNISGGGVVSVTGTSNGSASVSNVKADRTYDSVTGNPAFYDPGFTRASGIGFVGSVNVSSAGTALNLNGTANGVEPTAIGRTWAYTNPVSQAVSNLTDIAFVSKSGVQFSQGTLTYNVGTTSSIVGNSTNGYGVRMGDANASFAGGVRYFGVTGATLTGTSVNKDGIYVITAGGAFVSANSGTTLTINGTSTNSTGVVGPGFHANNEAASTSTPSTIVMNAVGKTGGYTLGGGAYDVIKLGSSFTINGTATTGSGINISGSIQASENASITLNGTSTQGNGVYSIDGSTWCSAAAGCGFGTIGGATAGEISITGKSMSGTGAQIGGGVISPRKITITGTTGVDANGTPVTSGGNINAYGVSIASLGIRSVGGYDFAGSNAIEITGNNMYVGATGNNHGVQIWGSGKSATEDTLFNNSLNGVTSISSKVSGITIGAPAKMSSGVNAGAFNLSAGDPTSKTNPANILATASNYAYQISQASNAGILVQTYGTGSLSAPKIVNSGAGNTVLSAGSLWPAAGPDTGANSVVGGQVLTVSGNTVTDSGTGNLYVYTANPGGSGNMSYLDSTNLGQLVYNGSTLAVNTQFNTAYTATPVPIAATASTPNINNRAQVFFRSVTKPAYTISLSDLTKVYGTSDPAALQAALNAAYVASGSVSSLTKVTGSTLATNNTFALAAADVINSLSGGRVAGENVGTYAYTNTALTPTADMNTTVSRQANMVITKATAQISGTKVYDGNTTMSGLTILGVNGETLSYTTGTGNANLAGVGASYIVNGIVLANGSGLASNYQLPDMTVANTNNRITITPAALVVTANNDAKFVTQADVAGYAGISGVGFVNGENVSTAGIGAAVTISRNNAGVEAAGVYNSALTASGASLIGNYAVTYVKGNYTITPAGQLKVVSSGVNTTYGDAPVTNFRPTISNVAYLDGNSNLISNLTYSSSTVNAAGRTVYTYTDSAGGSVSFSLTPTGAVYSSSNNLNAGNYGLGSNDFTKIGNDNLTSNTAVVTGNYTVNTKALTITAAPTSSVYNGATQTQAYTSGGLVAGDVVTVGGLASGKDVNTYNSALSSAGVDAQNYQVTYNNNALNITQAQLTVTGANNTTTYNGLTQTNGSPTISGVLGTDSFTANGVASGINAGSYTDNLAVTAGAGTNMNNYTVVKSNGVLTIGQAALTITAQSDAKFVTQADTAGYNGITSVGLVNGETLASTGIAQLVTVTRSNAGTEAAGVYNNVLVASGGSSIGNYAVTYQAGNYTITPAGQLKVASSGVNTTYGDAPVTNFRPTISNVAYLDGNSNLISNLTYSSSTVNAAGRTVYTYTDSAGGSVSFSLTPTGAVYSSSNNLNAGTYGLGSNDFTKIGNDNLTSNTAVVTGNYTVNTKALTITAAPTSSVYNGATQTQGLIATGLITGDAVGVTGLASGRNIGTYDSALVVSGADKANYQTTPNNNSFTIVKANLDVIGANTSVMYTGKEQTNAAPKLVGVQGSDVVSVTGMATGTKVSSVPYMDALQVASVDLANYNLQVSNGSLVIFEPADPVVAPKYDLINPLTPIILPGAPYASGVKVMESRCAPGSRYVQIDQDVLFDFDKDVIKSEFFPRLNKISSDLNLNKYEKVVITGHTDAEGSNPYNQKLSERRVAAVQKYFMNHQVAKDKVVVDAKGETMPIASNATAQGRSLNRRVSNTLLSDAGGDNGSLAQNPAWQEATQGMAKVEIPCEPCSANGDGFSSSCSAPATEKSK